MRTFFTPEQLADPKVQASQSAIRKCVHCGFCTATCPTYVLLGDERDSPRGRIELIKAMLEDGGPPAASTVTHVDRCLSCLACTTTCPSGVDYAQLIDHAREYIEAHHVRPWPERMLRRALAFVLTDRRRLGLAVGLGRLGRPLEPRLRRMGLKPLAAMLRLLPGADSSTRRPEGGDRSHLTMAPALASTSSPPAKPRGRGQGEGRLGWLRRGGQGLTALLVGHGGSIRWHTTARTGPLPTLSLSGLRPGGEEANFPLATEARKGRVILLQGCVEPALAPQIRAAAIRLITRAGYEVVLAEGEGCCGALSEHLGRADEARRMARVNLAAWARVGDVAAIVTTSAGCGTMLKSYQRVAGQAVPARDILEFIGEIGLPPVVHATGVSVAYHAACSLQHGQQIKAAPPKLLAEAGFEVRQVPEGHLCCGSAGVYNILQPELATQLRDRKAANIARTGATIVAAGNIGCMAQLAPVLDAVVVHPVELLDWATGGPKPAVLP